MFHLSTVAAETFAGICRRNDPSTHVAFIQQLCEEQEAFAWYIGNHGAALTYIGVIDVALDMNLQVPGRILELYWEYRRRVPRAYVTAVASKIAGV